VLELNGNPYRLPDGGKEILGQLRREALLEIAEVGEHTIFGKARKEPDFRLKNHWWVLGPQCCDQFRVRFRVIAGMHRLDLIFVLRGVEFCDESIDGWNCTTHRMPERDFGFALSL
jgi:hypothetical protein